MHSEYLNFVKQEGTCSHFLIYFLENNPDMFYNNIFHPRYFDVCRYALDKLFPCFNNPDFISLLDFNFENEFKLKTAHFLNEKQSILFKSFFEKIIIEKN